MPDSHVGWPRYCCGILVDSQGRFLMEHRGLGSYNAPGKLTCFGGGRERGEAPEACLLRELQEELGWQPAEIRYQLALHVDGKLVAWFYRAEFSVKLKDLQVLPGREAVLLNPADLETAPLSSWHYAALKAYLAGEPIATVDTRSSSTST